MTKTNYKAEYKRAKDQVTELQTQVSTLKERLDVLRKAKNQTVLKTEIVNRRISEPQFNNHEEVSDEHMRKEVGGGVREVGGGVREVGVNTDKPPSPPPIAPLPEDSPPVKRVQRKRVKEGWSQCKIYTDNKITQVAFVQACHCEGIPQAGGSPLKSGLSSPVTLPKIPIPSNIVSQHAVSRTATPELRTISRMKTKDFIPSEVHAAEISALEAAFRADREKQINIHKKEVASLKSAVEELGEALKSAIEEKARGALAGNGSVFHLYAEEKRRMEDQVSHLTKENHKLRNKNKHISADLKERETEWEENEENIRKNCLDTWDAQYRAWISKTDKKIQFLRNSNENMQNFLMKNAKHLPFAASEELKIYNEYGEKVSVFQ